MRNRWGKEIRKGMTVSAAKNEVAQFLRQHPQMLEELAEMMPHERLEFVRNYNKGPKRDLYKEFLQEESKRKSQEHRDYIIMRNLGIDARIEKKLGLSTKHRHTRRAFIGITRRKNPRRLYIITAQRPGGKLLKYARPTPTANGKFIQHGKAALFPSQVAAHAKARALVNRFAHALKGFTVAVRG
jgi:hypothetical protein